jgi:hypothetical protein
MQVSYLMVDQADMDLEMADDPFLEVHYILIDNVDL